MRKKYPVVLPAAERTELERLIVTGTAPARKLSHARIAEIEFSVLSRQCLRRRVPDRATLEAEVAAWQTRRNATAVPIDWRFTTDDARIKLKHLCPSVQA